MRLIGSKAEEDFRIELQRSNMTIACKNSSVHQALKKANHNPVKAYVLHHTSDQGVDHYTVLIDASYIVNLEIERGEKMQVIEIERQELDEYLFRLSKINKIRLSVAIELASEET